MSLPPFFPLLHNNNFIAHTINVMNPEVGSLCEIAPSGESHTPALEKFNRIADSVGRQRDHSWLLLLIIGS